MYTLYTLCVHIVHTLCAVIAAFTPPPATCMPHTTVPVYTGYNNINPLTSLNIASVTRSRQQKRTLRSSGFKWVSTNVTTSSCLCEHIHTYTNTDIPTPIHAHTGTPTPTHGHTRAHTYTPTLTTTRTYESTCMHLYIFSPIGRITPYTRTHIHIYIYIYDYLTYFSFLPIAKPSVSYV